MERFYYFHRESQNTFINLLEGTHVVYIVFYVLCIPPMILFIYHIGVRHNRLPDLQATKVKATLYSATKL